MAVKFGVTWVVVLLALLGAGCGSSPPPEPPPAPGPVFTSHADVVGCYEVVRLGWERLTLPSQLQGPASEPPHFFFLSDHLLSDGERKIKSRTAAHPYAAWRLKEE